MSTDLERQEESQRKAKEREAARIKQTEEEAIENRHRATSAAMAVKSSLPAKLQELLLGAAVPARCGCSDKLTAECAAHEAAVNAVQQSVQKVLSDLHQSIAAATETGNFGDVYTAIENLRFDRFASAQQVVQLWAKSLELNAKVRDELAPLVARAQENADAVLQQVKDDLTKIGSGIDAQQTDSGKYVAAAARQFEHAARMNTRARAARLAHSELRSNHRATMEVEPDIRRKLEAAKDFLHSVVLKEINP